MEDSIMFNTEFILDFLNFMMYIINTYILGKK